MPSPTLAQSFSRSCVAYPGRPPGGFVGYLGEPSLEELLQACGKVLSDDSTIQAWFVALLQTGAAAGAARRRR